MRTLLLLASALLLAIPAMAQELKLPPLSPLSTVTTEFSTSKIEITYNRPSMKGRKIFGGLVPFGEVWRTGANAATKITFGEEVEIGGKTIPAGSYSFYTIPNETEWVIIINKNTGSWNGTGWAKEDDMVRMTVKPSRTTQTVETFTLSIGNITFSSCTIDLMWENTVVSVPVKANNNERLMKNIEKAVERPTIPYRAAALYYIATDQNLDKALDYIQKAIDENPKAFWNHMTKAEIAAKLGKNDMAREAVAKVRELTKDTESETSYYSQTQAVLDQLK